MTEQVFDPVKFSEDSKKAWDTASRNYDRLIVPKFMPFTRALIEWAELKGSEQVLDVACGSGLVSLQIAKDPKFKGNILGVDFSSQMVGIARSKAAAALFKNLKFEEMDAQNLSLKDASFDVVFCQLGLMLFSNPNKALAEMRRALKDNGRVFVSVQGAPEKMCFTSLAMKTFVKHAPWLKVPGAPTLYSFGPEGVLDQALVAAGFTNVQTRRFQGSFSFSSTQEYWDTLVAGGGRTKGMLESLDKNLRETVQKETLNLASAYQKNGRVEIPYEVVLARASKRLPGQ